MCTRIAMVLRKTTAAVANASENTTEAVTRPTARDNFLWSALVLMVLLVVLSTLTEIYQGLVVFKMLPEDLGPFSIITTALLISRNPFFLLAMLSNLRETLCNWVSQSCTYSKQILVAPHKSGSSM